MWLVVFEILASFVLTRYVFVFCHIVAALVFYSVPVLSLRTHSTLQPTYVKDCKYYSRNYCCLVISFVLCHILLFILQWNVIPFKRNCDTSVEWKNYCVHFVFQHAYIPLILFPLLQLSAVPVCISEDISNFISRSVANTKTRLTDF
jgi:hypothetical protein